MKKYSTIPGARRKGLCGQGRPPTTTERTPHCRADVWISALSTHNIGMPKTSSNFRNALAFAGSVNGNYIDWQQGPFNSIYGNFEQRGKLQSNASNWKGQRHSFTVIGALKFKCLANWLVLLWGIVLGTSWSRGSRVFMCFHEFFHSRAIRLDRFKILKAS